MINESNKFPMISLIHPEIGVGSSGGSQRGTWVVNLKNCKYPSGPADLSSSWTPQSDYLRKSY